MTLFFLIRSLDPGGAERQLVALANGLATRGHAVHVAVFYSGGILENDLVGPTLHPLNKSGRWDAFGFLLRLARLVRSIRPHVAHGYLGGANLALSLTAPLHRVPVVWGVRASNMDLARYGLLHHAHFRLERLFSRSPAAIIYNSEAGRAHCEHLGFPHALGTVIENGIDTDRFQPDSEAGAALRREWNVPADALLVGLPARIDPMKDHEAFLRAAALVAGKRPDAHFVCIGGGDPALADRLRALAAELGIADRVIWAGSRSDMDSVYSALDLCCLSSAFGEGFPNVLGEAMACSVPCVATEVGDAARVLGDLGVSVPLRDPAALAGGIVAMQGRLETEGESLKRACRERMKTRFGLARMVERSESLLGEGSAVAAGG